MGRISYTLTTGEAGDRSPIKHAMVPLDRITCPTFPSASDPHCCDPVNDSTQPVSSAYSDTYLRRRTERREKRKNLASRTSDDDADSDDSWGWGIIRNNPKKLARWGDSLSPIPDDTTLTDPDPNTDLSDNISPPDGPAPPTQLPITNGELSDSFIPSDVPTPPTQPPTSDTCTTARQDPPPEADSRPDPTPDVPHCSTPPHPPDPHSDPPYDHSSYISATPCNIPVATPYPHPIPTASSALRPDPRTSTVIRLTLQSLDKPITPGTMKYINNIDTRTDAELEDDTDLSKKRKRQMMRVPFDTDPTTTSMIARHGRPTLRKRRTERWLGPTMSLFQTQAPDTFDPVRSNITQPPAEDRLFQHDTPIT